MAHRLELQTIIPNLVVTPHAHLGSWNAGGGRVLDRSMAIATFDSIVLNVVAVIEGDGLLDRIELATPPR